MTQLSHVCRFPSSRVCGIFLFEIDPLRRALREDHQAVKVFGRQRLRITRHVLNSARYKFLFSMGDDKCVTAAAETLMLPRGAEQIIPALNSGECLIRTPHWPHAMLAKIDYLPSNRGAQPVFDDNRRIPSQRLETLPHVVRALDKAAADYRTGKARRARAEYDGLRPAARKLLERAATHPYWPVARLYELDDVPSPRTQLAICRELQDGAYAEFEQVRLARRNLLLVALRPAAWSLLRKPPIELRGRGGIAHKCISAWIRMVGEKRACAQSVVEWLVPGTNHPADVAWHVDGRWRVFEVVVDCSDNLVGHLEAALLHSIDPIECVTIVAPQKAKLQPLRNSVEGALQLTSVLDLVAYEPAETFLKELWP